MKGSLPPWTPESWLGICDSLYKKYHGEFEENNRSFDHACDYLVQFRHLVRHIARGISREVFQREEADQVSVFLFGSSARVEMLGESDADVLVIRREDTPATKRFRNRFVEALKPYRFSKIDVPVWGTLGHCRAYLERSLVEANQLMESRFVVGSQSIRHQFERMQNEFDHPGLLERILVFHYHYFNQYYHQRGRPHEPNLKYGHGGTRDFLIPIGLYQLLEGCRVTRRSMEPTLIRALRSMMARGLISAGEGHRYREAANFIAFLRNELLILNKHGENRGLTFLTQGHVEHLAGRLKRKFASTEELKYQIDQSRELVFRWKQDCWRHLFHYFCHNRDPHWIACLKKIHSGQVSEAFLEKLFHEDVVLNVFAIWSLDAQGPRASPQGGLGVFESYFRQLGHSNQWEILCSLACHEKCPAPILHHIASNQGRRRGYEYVLKIIARNRNTSRETLNLIAQDGRIDFRFRQPAAVRLQHGLKRANQL